jgi:hypothetical protein
LLSSQGPRSVWIGWLSPIRKQYDAAGDWLWQKLRFAAPRNSTKLSSTPTATDIISIDSITYAAPAHSRTRYSLCSNKEVLSKSGQAGVFLTYVEWLVEQQAGSPQVDITELEAGLQVPHMEVDVQSDDDIDADDGGSDIDDEVRQQAEWGMEMDDSDENEDV